MYLSILILPFLGSLVSGLMGRKIGTSGAHFITCTCLILASSLATLAFYEVGLCGSPVSINLTSWIESEYMSISWEFLFDQLTADSHEQDRRNYLASLPPEDWPTPPLSLLRT